LKKGGRNKTQHKTHLPEINKPQARISGVEISMCDPIDSNTCILERANTIQILVLSVRVFYKLFFFIITMHLLHPQTFVVLVVSGMWTGGKKVWQDESTT
jgi:hypothetical protein